MKALLVKEVNCRADVEALTPLEQQQLVSAGRATVREATLEGVIRWSDKELLGWHHLRFESSPGVTAYEAWLLANGDDGVFFEPGAPAHCDLGVSQTLVGDMREHRDDVVARLQAASGLRGPAVQGVASRLMVASTAARYSGVAGSGHARTASMKTCGSPYPCASM